MATKSVKMRKVKATKGALMFLAEDESLPITNIYFRKESLAKLGMTEATEEIEISVTVK